MLKLGLIVLMDYIQKVIKENQQFINHIYF